MAFENLVADSSMEIYQFDVHVREKLNVVGRVMPYYVMSYLKKGEALLRIEGREYNLPAKSVAIIPTGVKHDHISVGDEPAVFLWWHFNFKLYQTLDVLKILQLPITLRLRDNLAFEQAFEEYIEISNATSNLRNVMLKKAKSIEIMALLLGAAEDEATNRRRLDVPDIFYTMLEDIINYKGDRQISLTNFAGKYNMHPTYISNHFKKIFGIAPIALYREVQVQRATQMLTDKNMSVSDVANELGFKDIATFSRFYSAKAGKTPSQVAQEKQLGITEIKIEDNQF